MLFNNRPYYRIVKKYYKKAFVILDKANFSDQAAFELFPLLYVLGDLFFHLAEKNRLQFSSEFPVANERAKWNSRMAFYAHVIQSGYVWGQYYYEDIPDSIKENPFCRCLIAFGDLLINPECVLDYENAPLSLHGIAETVQLCSAINQLFGVMDEYLNALSEL